MESSKPLLIIGPSLHSRGIGGVTIHVRRLLDYLGNNGFPYVFVDYKTSGFTKLIETIRRAEVLHLHISNPLYQFLLVSFCRVLGKRVIITIHGNYGRFGWLKNFLVRLSITLSSVPILINENSYIICRRFNKSATLISAFIPPQKEEQLQDSIIELLKKIHEKGKGIVSTNASNFALDNNGNDIYGIDFLISFFKSSAKMSLIVSDPSGNYKKRYHDLLTESVFFIDHPHSYFELLKHVDLFVRNTATDGDALSVKEALYLGVPTLCSDAVDRPNGVRLFKYSDEASFIHAMNMATKGNLGIENGAEKIVEVYKRML